MSKMTFNTIKIIENLIAKFILAFLLKTNK